MHVFVPPAPRPRVRHLDDAVRLVDGLAWLADGDEVVAVVVDDARQLLAVLACGSASWRVLAGDARPVILPTVALGGTEVVVVALGAPPERCVERARRAIADAADVTELRFGGLAVHDRPAAEPTGAGQTSSRRASP